MTAKKAAKETEMDWNIWHQPFLEAYDQIDFETCAKAVLLYKNIKFKDNSDPADDEQVDDMVDNLKDTVRSCTDSAIRQWMENNKKKDPNLNPWISETGFVRVSVWGPEAYEDNQAVIEIQILLENSFH